MREGCGSCTQGGVGGKGGRKVVERTELKMKLLYMIFYFFLDCLTLIFLEMTGIVILIVKK